MRCHNYKITALVAACGIFASTAAIGQIYSNGPVSTGATGENGTAAPALSTWSEMQHDAGNTTEANSSLGASGYAPTFRLADDFIVPAGQNWTITAIEFFAYKTGSAATPPPFASYTLRIWNGRPGDVGATVLCGDTTTNVLVAQTDTLIFRNANSVVPAPTALNNARRIWNNRVSVPAGCAAASFFVPGTYWLDWASVDLAATTHFYPAVTVPGSRTTPGVNNARQLTSGTGVWADVLDTGTPVTAPDVPQTMPFLIYGTLPVSLQNYSID